MAVFSSHLFLPACYGARWSPRRPRQRSPAASALQDPSSFLSVEDMGTARLLLLHFFLELWIFWPFSFVLLARLDGVVKEVGSFTLMPIGKHTHNELDVF